MESLLTLITIIGLIYLIFKISRLYYDNPTLQEYVEQNPQCNTGNGIKCFNCGSKSIKNWGITNPNSYNRIHICNHCGIQLYRS